MERNDEYRVKNKLSWANPFRWQRCNFHLIAAKLTNAHNVESGIEEFVSNMNKPVIALIKASFIFGIWVERMNDLTHCNDTHDKKNKMMRRFYYFCAVRRVRLARE